MRALAELAREHAAIGALVTRFEQEVAALVRGMDLDPEAIDRLIGFFEHEVDGHHQEKEEDLLLPRLRLRAGAGDLAILRTLTHEHNSQRHVLTGMRAQVEGVTYGEPISMGVLVREARRYVNHQRAHSRWEQLVVFPFARRLLLPADDEFLWLAFRERDEIRGATLWDEACSLAEWLDQRRATVPVAA